MLHLIPASWHRQVLRVGHRLRKRWRRASRRPGGGVSVIGIDAKGRILLVRHSYGSGRWALPGGGLRHGEDPAACARREMREELGCELEQVELAAAFDEELFGAPHRAWVFTARFVSEPRPDGREIVETGWFAREDFPPDLVSFARHRLKLAFDED